MAWLVIENIAIYGIVAYLIGTGHSLWWLLLLLWTNYSKANNSTDSA